MCFLCAQEHTDVCSLPPFTRTDVPFLGLKNLRPCGSFSWSHGWEWFTSPSNVLKNIHVYVFMVSGKTYACMFLWSPATRGRVQLSRAYGLTAGSKGCTHGCQWTSGRPTCRHSQAAVGTCSKTTHVCPIALRKTYISMFSVAQKTY